jgi:hypothetical protein
MHSIIVDIVLHEDELLRVYAGRADQILATSADGRRVRFPANILRPFVARDGVHGRFEIRTDANGRFQSIHRR